MSPSARAVERVGAGFRIQNMNITTLLRNAGGDGMRRWGALALAVFMAAGSLAVASAQGTKGVLRVGLESDPPNMDPHRSNAAVDRQVFQSLFDKLVDM